MDKDTAPQPLFQNSQSLSSIYHYLLHSSLDETVLHRQITWYAALVAIPTSLIVALVSFALANQIDFWVSMLALSVSVFSLWLLKINQSDLAINVLLLGATIGVWVGVLIRGGLNDVGLQAIYPIFVVVSILFSRQGRVIFYAINFILIFMLIFLEFAGFYTNFRDPESYVQKAIVLLSISFLTIIVVNFIMYKLERANQKLKEAKQELQKTMKEKDVLLSMLTHDMKSPLTTIGLYAELIEKRPSVVQEKPQIVDQILKSQQSLNDLVKDILELEKLKTDRQDPLIIDQVNLLELVHAASRMMEAQAEKKQIRLITTSRSGDNYVMRGDQAKLERVIVNLISNAIKYSPSQTEVNLSVKAGAQLMIVTIQDQGYGIPPEELEAIFDPYRRTQANLSKAKGTGLGLAIVKEIVEQHRGTIEVESAVNVGSCFMIKLPKYTVPEKIDAFDPR